MIKKINTSLALACLMLSPYALATEANCKEDFPTAVIADYVLGCMAANGNTFASLHQCSCSIDYIKSKMSYSDFEKAKRDLAIIFQAYGAKGSPT